MTRPAPRRTAPTLPEVAEASGVSVATAARALGGYGSVSERSREKVLAAAERLGYRANGLARSMVTGRTMTLGIVVGDVENFFFARVARAFSDVARMEGFDVIVASTDEDVATERAAVRLLMERRVDGLAVAPASMNEVDHLVAAQRQGANLLVLDRRTPGLNVDSVLIDSVAAAHDAVAALTSAGHTRIAMVTGGLGTSAGAPAGGRIVSTGVDRLAGYRAALSEAGLPHREDYVVSGDFHLDSARARARALLGAQDRPTAVFATDSTVTLGVLLAIRDLGLSCPDDVSVAGFDDPDWAGVVRPGISVVSQPVYELGALAGRRLVARVRGEVRRARRHLLPTTWLARGSIAPPRSSLSRSRSSRD